MGTKRDEVVKALEVLIAERNFCTNQKYVEACGLFCSARRVMVSDLAKSNHNECTKDCEHYSPPHIYCVLKDALSLIKELTEECKKIGIENFDLICELSRIKEDTVQKMKDRLINYESYDNGGGNYVVSVDDIRTVAEEILSQSNSQLKPIRAFTKEEVERVANDSKAIIEAIQTMHSEIEARCIKGGIYPAFVKNVVNQVA